MWPKPAKTNKRFKCAAKAGVRAPAFTFWQARHGLMAFRMEGGMNLYHCLVELKSEARALAFAAAVEG
ncbi:hypothetical protein K4G91_23810, partial [Mycobacterium tuberculosis]|uniref:DUF6614 family protein n=1 Tax=Mycobacterium tuberculosis TaxID=1773 RepID=UPI001C7DC7E1|nr:hypothetical protein [Mycobacterium tuberculosis]